MVKEVLALDVSNVETEVVTPRPSEFTLIDEADTFFNELQESIRNAKSTIQFQSFLFGKTLREKNRSVGDRVLTELVAAARRGVRVQIMTDGMFPLPLRWGVTRGAKHHIRTVQKELAREDIGKRVEERRNLEFQFAFERFRASPNPLKMAGILFNRLAERDHTKNIIIDAEDPENGIAYIGGRNTWRKDKANADFMVRIRGEMVGLASQAFQESWDKKIEANVWTDSKGNELVRDGRNTDVIFDKLIDAMKGATQRVWLQTPYFDRVHLSPYIIALRKWLPSQVDMKFLTPVPKSNNQFTYKKSSPYYMQELSEEGIMVKCYQENNAESKPVFIHAKGLIVDGAIDPTTGERASGVGVIGSSNFSKRKVLGGRNAEVNLFIRDPEFIAQLEAWYEKCFEKSIDYDRSRPNAFLRRLYRVVRVPWSTPSVEDAREFLDYGRIRPHAFLRRLHRIMKLLKNTSSVGKTDKPLKKK